ncbi:cytochrome P450 [Myriangium duriaei CBS 260.36]|uniref:Cytochrome P450 n=1 Tax=Myriangium duriaei CBS 260.36 TaxID=1168546 RepID=A0A9P4ITU2_9PEZI|nr:cytochrome P450 [Myriangium duriaei CBS 260.36]
MVLGLTVSTDEWIALCALGFAILTIVTILFHVGRQLLLANRHEPPVVFHWLPFLGSTVSYGIDPYKFFFDARKKYGDIFTFVLLGRKTTVYLGTAGNDFILNAKIRDVNAEEVYGCLTTPVFGKDVIYDCPNLKFMEQKKFVKSSLTTTALQSLVLATLQETRIFFSKEAAHKRFSSKKGTCEVSSAMAELTLYTASRSLQGQDVRDKFDSTFADLYHDLDMGFTPINFMLPWVPLPHNRKRDLAQKKMANIYMNIIKDKREAPPNDHDGSLIRELMDCRYKDGSAMQDHEIAHMMIALLMAGQHSSSSTISWVVLRLASRPDIQDELLAEQHHVLGLHADGSTKDLTYQDMSRLTLHAQVVKETLRLHSPIHSILRRVISPMQIEGTAYVVPASHNLLASPGVTSRMDKHFPQPLLWEPHRWDNAPTQRYADLSPVSHSGSLPGTQGSGFGAIGKGGTSPYLPFGAGRHRCIGEQFAYTQLQTILVGIVRDFRFTPKHGQGKMVETDYRSLFSRPVSPAWVSWERRDPAEHD